MNKNILAFIIPYIYRLSAPSLLRHFPLCLLTALLLPILSSCSQEFEPDIEEPDVLVLNVLARPDSLVWASVSHSWVFNDGNNWRSVIVDDAIAECSLNDGEWLPMVYD